MNKAEALDQREAWLRALQAVAKELGYERTMTGDASHPIVKILGAIAWGRHPKEGGPNESKDTVVEGLGYLQGIRDAALRAARVLGDEKADRLLCDVPMVARRRLNR